MGSFDTGFNFGLSAYNNAMAAKERALDRERQERLDSSNAELLSLQKQRIRSDLDAQQRKDSDAQELRDASDTSVRSTTAFKFGDATSSEMTPESAAQSAEAIKSANANLPEDQRIPEPQVVNEVVAGRGAAAKRYASDFVGVRDAKAYAESLKDPISALSRKVDILRRQGKDDEANALELGAVEQKNKLYSANLSALRRTVLSELAKKGPGAVADMYSQHYGDGLTAKFVPGPDGSGSIIRSKDDKVVDEIKFSNANELAGKLDDLLDPEKGLERYRRLESEKASVVAKEKTRQDVLQDQMKLIDYREYKGAGRGVGGAGGAGGAAAPNPSAGFDRAKMYAKNLERWQKIADGDVATPGSKLTPAQISQNALKDTDAAQSAWVDSSKARNQAGTIHQLMKPSKNTAMSPDSQEYADLYLGVSQAKGQAIPREYMDSLGYPYPGLWAGRNRVATPKTK